MIVVYIYIYNHDRLDGFSKETQQREPWKASGGNFAFSKKDLPQDWARKAERHRETSSQDWTNERSPQDWQTHST